MYCKNCGNELKENEVFCGMCGNKVVIDNTSGILQNSSLNMNNQNISQPSYDYYRSSFNNNQNSNKKNNSWKNAVSFVIGIVSLVLVFLFQILTMPLSIVGLVFGILAIKENKKYKVGLILNIISLILAISMFMFYSNIPINQAIGTWDCKKFDGVGAGSDYVVTMQLNNDNEFIWNKYNDAKNNHVIGTYEFEDLHKTNYGKTANYYQITLNGEEYVNNGELQSEAYKSKYEMGILKNTDEAIIINVNTYNMYYCYRSDKTSKRVK